MDLGRPASVPAKIIYGLSLDVLDLDLIGLMHLPNTEEGLGLEEGKDKESSSGT